MYQNPNFLGGNAQNPVMPGAQYGGSFGTGAGLPQQQQAPQPSPFAPQPTGVPGFQQAPIQPNFTGFPGLQQPQPTGQLQPHLTGFGSQAMPSAAPPVPAIPQQFQQQFQQQQQRQPQLPSPFASAPSQVAPPALAPPPAPIKTQPTGFKEMAASFQTAAKPAPAAAPRRTNKVPNIRLSFITAQDQAKFETLFKSAVGESQTTMSGEQARDLLLRSQLDGDTLSHIWTLADTTRSGQLHFPEFALAMYLCNLKLTGKSLPSTLPEKIKNEVSSMVDIINFSVAEEATSSSSKAANAPEFNVQNAAAPPVIQQPQPQPSASQLLQAQMTGFPSLQPQPTGFPGQGLQAQPTGMPTATGYTGPRPPMPPMPTGFGSTLSPNAAAGGMVAPLNAQPTGRPGQWGLVNTPATGLPNIDALQARMMPQAGREQRNFTTAGLQGNAVIPWAITKDEKTRYDELFRAWDGLNKGYIAGDQAIEIFGQSGLEKSDLERIWTLADNGNKGRLNLDEFAVAMHLIYRKLNGYPIPNQLPPELVPPSTRNVNEALGTIKNLLHQESDFRKNSGAALLPQKTGVSYLKSHSFKATSAPGTRKDATVFKNNDDEVGYRSTARRRVGNVSPRPDSPASTASGEDLTIEQLRKKIKERQVLLDAMDFADEKNAEEDEILDRRDRREAEELYRRIRRVQEDIDNHPDAHLVSGDSGAERRALKRQLQALTDKIPELASQVRKTEKAIADARLELFRLRDAKAHPGSSAAIIGTGPGGTITEADRLKARAKAMMQQRTAALTGKKIDVSGDLEAEKRLEEENIKVRTEKENNERMVRDVEDSVREFAKSIEDNLKEGTEDSTSEHERRRWEDALGVEDEVRDFIYDLQRSSRAARIRAQERQPAQPPVKAELSPATRVESPPTASRTASPASAAGSGSYSAYKTPEERAAFIRQQAEQRMAERLAALGLKPPTKPGETPAQRAERERAERAAKLRQAEEEDARREAERQARLAEEQGVPPPPPPPPASRSETKKPPPPPSRKAVKVDDSKKAEEERLEQEREEQERATRELEEQAGAQEDELAKEREAAEARLRALEEQVRQNKLKKEEEKRRKKAALAEAKKKEEELAQRRAEIEAARKREEELRKQLEALENESSSSDDEGPEQITPQASTPTVGDSQVLNKEPERQPTPPPPAPAVAPPQVITSSPSAERESKNPYFRMMSQSQQQPAAAETPSAAPAPPAPAPPPPPPPPPQPEVSTNPFHRMTQAAAAPTTAPTISFTRSRPVDDGWGSGSEKDDEDSDSDDDRPGGASAAQLASILFGTMGPPRPLSAAGDRSAPTSPRPGASPVASPPPVPATTAPFAPHPPPPPPPPPMPGSAAPPPPPPPPPPPSSGAPPPPPPPLRRLRVVHPLPAAPSAASGRCTRSPAAPAACGRCARTAIHGSAGGLVGRDPSREAAQKDCDEG
ncbi:hypothetical protein VTJ83DRAFT_2565 [Remersonia thermophila]|uniref:Actin cytoskeleton-regulatory complex protein PAN1 n=1 Tax=Remersonia thermophila TaxID=72144 RepID=A0ABR4DKK8_9PEZI